MTNLTKTNHTNPSGEVVTIYVGENVKIGEGVTIGDGVVIDQDAKISPGVDIGAYSVISPGVEIGNDVWIGPDAVIGDGVWIGPGAVIGAGAEIGEGSKTLDPIHIAKLSNSRSGWVVTITEEYMQIGCQFHPTKDWWGFDDKRISEMDRQALRWWRDFKPALQALCLGRGWVEGIEG